MDEYSRIELRGDPEPLKGAISEALDALGSYVDKAFAYVERVFGGFDFGSLVSRTLTNIEGFEDMQAKLRVLDNTLKQFGSSSNMASSDLAKMRLELRKVSNETAESWVGAQRGMLQFNNVRFPVFQEALRQSDNLAKGLGMGLSSAVDTVGEALQKPIDGISKLASVGIFLDSSQRALIRALTKTGDILGAQRIILKELEGAYGGAGEAALNTFGGRMSRLADVSRRLWEDLSGHLVPYLIKAIDFYEKCARVVSGVIKQMLSYWGQSTNGAQQMFDALEAGFKYVVDLVVIGYSYIEAVVTTAGGTWTGVWLKIKGVTLIAIADMINYVRAFSLNLKGTWDWLVSATKPVWEAVATIFKTAYEKMYNITVIVYQAMVKIAARATVAIVEVFKDLAVIVGVLALKSVITVAKHYFMLPGYLLGAVVAMNMVFSAFVVNVVKMFIALQLKVQDVFIGIVKLGFSAFKGLFNVVVETFKGFGVAIGFAMTSFQTFVGFVARVAAGIAQIFFKVFWFVNGGFAIMLFNGAKSLFDLREHFIAWGDKIGEILMELWIAFTDWWNGIKKKAKGEDSKWEFKGLKDGANDALGEISGMIDELNKELKGIEIGLPELDVEIPPIEDIEASIRKAGLDALGQGPDGAPGVDDVFQGLLDKNRDIVSNLGDLFDQLGAADPYKDITGDGGKYRPQGRDTRPIPSNIGGFEDLAAMNRRIQTAAVKPPDVAELERQTALMQEQNALAKSQHDRLIAIHNAVKDPPKPQVPRFQ